MCVKYSKVQFFTRLCWITFTWDKLRRRSCNAAASERLKRSYFQFGCCKRHVLVCLALHYQGSAGVWMASSNRKDLLSSSWIAEPPSHIMLNTIMQTYFFQWVQRKIMALIYALTSSKCFVCKLGKIFRDGEAEGLLHPSFVARRIKGDLLWFVNMRAFDSDWNETMCRIRLKTMCGEWRLRHMLDFNHPYTDVHHCGPIVWPGSSCEVGFFPSCFCSVMGYNNLNKSHWLSLSSMVWAWQWWKAWFSRELVSRK